MSIRKLSELPFVNVDDNLLSAGILEVSKPTTTSDSGDFASNAMFVNDFKTYIIKDVINKRDFPEGIYISSFTDIVGGLSVNTRDDSVSGDRSVVINGDPVTIRSTNSVAIASPSTKLYATEGPVGVYTDKFDSTGIVQMHKVGDSNSAKLTIPTSTTTTIYSIPKIIATSDAILASGGNAAVNVAALESTLDEYKATLDSVISAFGNMAFCDYFVSDQNAPAIPARNTFYFYVQYYGY